MMSTITPPLVALREVPVSISDVHYETPKYITVTYIDEISTDHNNIYYGKRYV